MTVRMARGMELPWLSSRERHISGRALDGEKLFVSSHPAVETQAFYAAMGCVEAEEFSPDHARREPADLQIECSLYQTA